MYNETETQTANREVIDDQTARLFMKILMFGVTPFISIFGVVGNIFSMIILRLHGLNKCSNILLIVLAFSDIVYLIAFNSVPKVIYEAVWNRAWAGYSKSSCDIVFFFYSFFTLLDYTFSLITLTLPMLITAERLLVVFLPLTFGQILTPGRTWMAVLGLAIYWMSVFLYCSSWQVLWFDVDPDRNISRGLIGNSHIFLDNLETVAGIQTLVIYTGLVIPPVFTVTGCVVIAIQVRLTTLKRRKMMSKTRSTNRTTKILLAINAVYCVTAAVLSLPVYIPEYISYTLTDGAPSNLKRIAYQLVNLVECSNSSSNFVVYVVLNKRFRDTLKKLLGLSK